MELAGCNYTFLNNLARTGLLAPSVQPAAGKGSNRLYSFSDVLALRAIRQLREAGFELQELRGMVDWLLNPNLLAAIRNDPHNYQYLLSRGTEVKPVSMQGLWTIFGPSDQVPVSIVLNLRALVDELTIAAESLEAGLGGTSSGPA
jgi:DNA-binding transcriptional MerR regulator